MDELSSGLVKLNNELLAHWSKALWELKGNRSGRQVMVRNRIVGTYDKALTQTISGRTIADRVCQQLTDH